MVAPAFLADTCTPSSFWPEAEVIEPVRSWSAEAPPAAKPTMRPATLANNFPRISVMVRLSFKALMASLAAAGRARGRSSSLDRYGSHIRNDGFDLLRLQEVFEGRHARRAICDELAHDVIVPTAGVLVKRRAVGLGAKRRREMADPARLGEHLPPHFLLISKIAPGLLGGCTLGGCREHQQTKQSCDFHDFPPFLACFEQSYAAA